MQGIVLAALSAVLVVAPAYGQDAEALRWRYGALREALGHSSFGRPLLVDSARATGEQKGEVFSVVARPFGVVAAGLAHAHAWCDILILQTNVKRCDTTQSGSAATLTVFVTRKPEDRIGSAYRIALGYHVAASTRDYLRVALSSPSGPLGTSDYRIALEAGALDAGRAFIHLSYSYSLGVAARIAVRGYLATSGRNKVGFSIVGRRPDGEPVYVQGVRGIVERNAMRYYLAVDAYLAALDAPPGQRLEKRLRRWHAGIERYPMQLRPEMSREEYVAMKSREVAAVPAPVRAGAPR